MTDELRRHAPRQRLTRAEKKAQTRRRLLDSAHALIALKGYEGAAIDEIAEDAGYSRGAFYSNFANKQELVTELIKSCFDADLVGIDQMGAPDDLPALRKGFCAIAAQYAADPEKLMWMLEFQLAAVRHAEVRASYTAEFDKLKQAVRELIVQAFASVGHADPYSTGRFTDVFVVMLTGLSLMKLLYPDSFDDDLIGEAFMSLIRGIPGSPLAGR